MDYDQVITVQYEGFEAFEFLLIPSNNDPRKFCVYCFTGDKLTDLMLKIKNQDNSMVIRNEAGEVFVEFDNNIVKDINVIYKSTSINSTARANECSLAKDFIQYTGGIQLQIKDFVRYSGTFFIDVACSAWILYRGAFPVADAIYAIGYCIS